MNSNLKDDLLGLRSKLENLEKDFEVKLKDVEEKEAKFKKLDEQINELISTGDTVITLNVGGKIFQTKASTLLSKKDTLFYKLLSADTDGKEYFRIKEYFFDRNYQFFPFILDYLRTDKYCLKGFNKFELEDLLEDCEFYGLTEIIASFERMEKEAEFVNFDAAPRYSNAGTHRLEDLNDRSLMKGICVGSPFYITFELNYEHHIETIEIGGYNGNSGIWYVGNGSGASVHTSTDKVTWKLVGTVNLGDTIQTINLTPSIGRYIKFQHNSHLGIGYLKILGKTNKK